MEQLQEGYVFSVAATAGCVVTKIDRDVYGMDIQIVKSYGSDTEEQIIQVQLKNTTTIKPDVTKADFPYKFKAKEHLERLALSRRHLKSILVVMVTDPRQNQWTFGDHDALMTSHCCYWANLEGYDVKPNVAQPTVRIPVANAFDSDALLSMFRRLESTGAI
jgi:hypothetical protein